VAAPHELLVDKTKWQQKLNGKSCFVSNQYHIVAQTLTSRNSGRVYFCHQDGSHPQAEKPLVQSVLK
jgi:hypothetical protein